MPLPQPFPKSESDLREGDPHRGLFWRIKAAPTSREPGSIVPYGKYCHGGAGHGTLVIMPVLDVVAIMFCNRTTP